MSRSGCFGVFMTNGNAHGKARDVVRGFLCEGLVFGIITTTEFLSRGDV